MPGDASSDSLTDTRAPAGGGGRIFATLPRVLSVGHADGNVDDKIVRVLRTT